MPVAIIVTDDSIPAIIERDDDAQLLAALGALAVTPEFFDLAHARRWLAGLAAPSGYFESRADALAAAQAAKARATAPPAPLTPERIRDARKKVGLSRVAFGEAIGFKGNANTINKAIHQIETDAKKTLSKDKQAALFALMAEHELQAENERA